MSLKTKRRIIFAKTESTYGTDPVPTGANAILVKNLAFTPIEAETVERDLDRPYFGNSEKLLAQLNAKVEFEVELAGSGVPGVAPAWAPLLKSCAFSETLDTNAVTIASSTTTATVTETAHGRTNGSRVVISGATEPEYNGTFTITVVNSNSYTYTMLADPTGSSATGSPVVGINAVYEPISESIPSITLYVNVDGVQHIVTGAFGNVSFSINVKQIPVMKFTFTGIYNDPTDDAAATPDFTGFQLPKVANTQNTSNFSIFGFSSCLESFELDMANDVQYRTYIGCENVNVLDRKPAGSFVVEAPLLATKDFFEIAKEGTVGTMELTHGISSGNIVKIESPHITIENPNYQDADGIQMLNLPFTASPDAGNDEIVITCQ